MSEHAKSFAFGDWTLNDILNNPCLTGSLFRVPDYQRGYAWEERQLEEFWEDLTSNKERHYMGALTVEHHGGEAGHPDFYDVVDGQQRLTTIAILLSVLCNTDENPLLSRFAYEAGNDNRDFFATLLALPRFPPATASDSDPVFPAPASLPGPTNAYQRNLVAAKSFFSEKASDEPDKIDEWKRFVFEKLVFDFRVLGDDDDAEIVFETMNNRGKPLTLLEKLKNRLMYLSEIVGDGEGSDEDDNPDGTATLRKRINSAWGEIYRALASDPNRDPLDEDEFVAAHLSVYRNPEESVYSENVAASRLFKMFCEHPERHPVSEEIDERRADAVARAEKEPPLSFTKIGHYVENLRTFAPAWAAVHREFGSACGQCRLLSDRRETKIFLAAVFLHVQDEGLRENVYEAARQILFRNTIGAGMDRTRFATLARRLHGVCVGQLKRGQRTPLDGTGVLAELRNVLDNERKRPTVQTLIEFFADKQKGDFYGWSELGMRYFLMRHEADYPGRADGTQRLTWEMFENVSVEHVLPQSAADKDSKGWSLWNRLILDWTDQAGSEDPTDAQLRAAAETLSGTLGNLVLLTREENSEISNKPWDTYPTTTGKRDFYLDSSHRSSNGAVALAASAESWNAWHIRERGRELFRKLAADFGVTDCLSDEAVDNALGLPDIIDPNEGDYLSDRPIPRLPEEEVARNVRRDEEEDRTGFRLPVTETRIREFLEADDHTDDRGYLCFAQNQSGWVVLHMTNGGRLRFLVYATTNKLAWRNRLMGVDRWPSRPEIPPYDHGNPQTGNVIQFVVPNQNWRTGRVNADELFAFGTAIIDILEEEHFFV